MRLFEKFPPINTSGYVLTVSGILVLPSKETLGVESETPMSVYKRDGSPFYQMYVPGSELKSGKDVRISTKATTMEDAQRFEKAFRQQRGRSDPVFEKPQSMTFKELWEKCLLEFRATKSSGDAYYKSHSGEFLACFGDKLIDEIEPADIIDFRNLRSTQFKRVGKLAKPSNKTVSPITVNHELAILKQCFNIAIRHKLLTKNPVNKDVQFLKQDKGRIRHLDYAEQVRFLNAIPHPFKHLVLVAMRTGFRKSELIGKARGNTPGLCVKNVNFETKLITLTTPTKNGETRSIAFGPSLEPVLKELCAGKGKESPLFVEQGPNGPVKMRYNFNRIWATACKAAKITNFRFHDLRHTFASDQVAAGTSLRALMGLMGHKTYEMVMIYAHLQVGFAQAETERLERYLSKCEGMTSQNPVLAV